jgi:hypothetical protein
MAVLVKKVAWGILKGRSLVGSSEVGTTVAAWLTKDWTGEISDNHAEAPQPGAEWACGGLSGSSHWH